jgi:hypothetical protein
MRSQILEQQQEYQGTSWGEQLLCSEWLAWSVCRNGFVGVQVLVDLSPMGSSRDKQNNPECQEDLEKIPFQFDFWFNCM